MDVPRPKRRILLVDDHPIIRSGFSEIIRRCHDMEVVREVGDAESALLWLETNLPDIVIADISLPTMNGIEMTKVIRQRYPALPVLIVSMHEEALYAERALRAGARGYVTKLEPPDVLLNAARCVLAGEVYISKCTTARLLKTMVEVPPGSNAFADKMERMKALTDRELEVFEAIGTGLTTREIAARLDRSIKTVEAHRTNIISKLGLPGSATLRECATDWIANGRRGRVSTTDAAQNSPRPADPLPPPQTLAAAAPPPSNDPGANGLAGQSNPNRSNEEYLDGSSGGW